MAKIKELLANRERLKNYDDLKKWRENFEGDKVHSINGWRLEPGGEFPLLSKLPDYIRDIAISAIDAEIKKLEEE